MRTTITLDPDTAALVQRQMRARGASFKVVVNDAIRASLATGDRQPFATRTADMGTPTVTLDQALRLAGELEDEELVRRMRAGK